MKMNLKAWSLSLIILATQSHNAFAVPVAAQAQNFPNVGALSCVQMFDNSTSTTDHGRISCARSGGSLACVVGENASNGARAALKLANGTKLSSRDSRNTYGAMVVRRDGVLMAGTTKATSKLQQDTAAGKEYTKADALIVPIAETAAGFFAKATLIVPTKIHGHSYNIQESSIIAGRNTDGETSFFAIVTPENDVVVQYVQNGTQSGFKCSNLPADILGQYLVSSGIAFVN